MSFLELNGISKNFGGLKALDEIDFNVQHGSITAVIGPNGAGKTTLFNCISGSQKIDSGSISFKGDNIHNSQTHNVALKGISRTFQNIKLFAHMTVLENVMVGRHIQSRSGFLSSMLSLPKALKEERSIRSRSMEILSFLGMAEYAKIDALSLPFGKQRILEMARALALEPVLLLLDEPAAGLNSHETQKMAGIIKNIRDLGITVLLIEHDMSLVMEISDLIVVLSSGQKIAEGNPREIQHNKEVITVYLGEEDAADK